MPYARRSGELIVRAWKLHRFEERRTPVRVMIFGRAPYDEHSDGNHLDAVLLRGGKPLASRWRLETDTIYRWPEPTIWAGTFSFETWRGKSWRRPPYAITTTYRIEGSDAVRIVEVFLEAREDDLACVRFWAKRHWTKD